MSPKYKVIPISFEPEVAKLLEPYRETRQASRLVNDIVKAYFQNHPPEEKINEATVKRIVEDYLKEHGGVVTGLVPDNEWETGPVEESGNSEDGNDPLDEFLNGLKEE